MGISSVRPHLGQAASVSTQQLKSTMWDSAKQWAHLKAHSRQQFLYSSQQLATQLQFILHRHGHSSHSHSSHSWHPLHCALLQLHKKGERSIIKGEQRIRPIPHKQHFHSSFMKDRFSGTTLFPHSHIASILTSSKAAPGFGIMFTSSSHMLSLTIFSTIFSTSHQLLRVFQ